jgi:hypothetical protein
MDCENLRIISVMTSGFISEFEPRISQYEPGTPVEATCYVHCIVIVII